MTAYVPLTTLDIAAIYRARHALLKHAELGDTIAYSDCIRLDSIIEAYDDLSKIKIEGTTGPANALTADQTQVVRMDTTCGQSLDAGGPALPPLARPAPTFNRDGYDSAMRWHAAHERGEV